MTASAVLPLEETLVIVGVGLIGGSIAAAARERGIARRILGAGRNSERLEQARKIGLIDAAVTESTRLGDRPLVVICTPVDHIARDVQTWLARLPAGGLVTDAGSTKARICETLADFAGRQPTFLGSHPIAGSEKQGFEHADPNLYAGRTCVITPLAGHRESDIARVTRFWESLGMTVVSLSPADHDRALATTSHLPHVTAAALVDCLPDADRGLTGTGFASATRMAAGDPALWTAILQENAGDVADALAALQRRLAEYEKALRARDEAGLKSLLQAAKTRRDALDGNGSQL
jgi:prephenate dehydrogenase